MIKFEVIHLGNAYRLNAKGSGIGSGIAWTWIGDFATKKLVQLMKKALLRDAGL